jgi:hypothetical protein
MPFYYYLSKIFVNLGEFETALFYFEKGVQSRATPLLFANIDCAFDAIRNEPRFEKALKSLNLGMPCPIPEKEKYKRSNFTQQQISDIARKLTQLMDTDKPYLNPRLSLPDLAELIDITTNHL